MVGYRRCLLIKQLYALLGKLARVGAAHMDIKKDNVLVRRAMDMAVWRAESEQNGLVRASIDQ